MKIARSNAITMCEKIIDGIMQFEMRCLLNIGMIKLFSEGMSKDMISARFLSAEYNSLY